MTTPINSDAGGQAYDLRPRDVKRKKSSTSESWSLISSDSESMSSEESDVSDFTPEVDAEDDSTNDEGKPLVKKMKSEKITEPQEPTMEVRSVVQNPELTEEVAQEIRQLHAAALMAMENPTGTFIDPYGTSTAIVGVSEVDRNFAAAVLGNTGVHTLTDYPVSTSPRMPEVDIGRAALNWGGWPFPMTTEVGEEIWHRRCLRVDTEEVRFAQFSYDAPYQPRTETARDDDGLPVSPGSRPLPHQMSHAERVAASAQSVPFEDE